MPTNPKIDGVSEGQKLNNGVVNWLTACLPVFIDRVHTVASGLLISFKDAKVRLFISLARLRWYTPSVQVALLKWSDAIYDLVTVSIHMYKRAPQLVRVFTPLSRLSSTAIFSSLLNSLFRAMWPFLLLSLPKHTRSLSYLSFKRKSNWKDSSQQR